MLSRGASDTGLVNLLFEFERHNCIDIYSVLIAAGVDLSPSGQFTARSQASTWRFRRIPQSGRKIRNLRTRHEPNR